MRGKPFDKGDYIQVQTGVHAGKEGEVIERKRRQDRHGDELIIAVMTPIYPGSDTLYPANTSVDPLKCKMHSRPSKV